MERSTRTAVPSPSNAPRDPVKRGALAVIGVTVVVNATLLGLAALDRSWGALGILVLWGPMANAVIALFSLALLPLVRLAANGASLSRYVGAALLTPPLAIGVDTICILLMDLSGC